MTARGDAIIAHLRDQITELDRALVRTLNTRIRLVAALKRYKERQGIDFLDPQREQQMLQDLERVNSGPLSTGAVQELFAKILDLTKREVENVGDP